MKFVKLGIFTLALGMFIASCGNEASEEATEETTEEMAPVVEEAPMTEVAPVTDSTVAPVTETPAETPAQ